MARRKITFPGSTSGNWEVTNTSMEAGMTHIHDERFDRIEKALEKINERLAILEEPTPERLEAFKQLQDAYNKYKFLDELCGAHDEPAED